VRKSNQSGKKTYKNTLKEKLRKKWKEREKRLNKIRMNMVTRRKKRKLEVNSSMTAGNEDKVIEAEEDSAVQKVAMKEEEIRNLLMKQRKTEDISANRVKCSKSLRPNLKQVTKRRMKFLVAFIVSP
jgi:hypothetical protein